MHFIFFGFTQLSKGKWNLTVLFICNDLLVASGILTPLPDVCTNSSDMRLQESESAFGSVLQLHPSQEVWEDRTQPGHCPKGTHYLEVDQILGAWEALEIATT